MKTLCPENKGNPLGSMFSTLHQSESDFFFFVNLTKSHFNTVIKEKKEAHHFSQSKRWKHLKNRCSENSKVTTEERLFQVYGWTTQHCPVQTRFKTSCTYLGTVCSTCSGTSSSRGTLRTKIYTDKEKYAELQDHLKVSEKYGEGSCPCFYGGFYHFTVSKSRGNYRYLYFEWQIIWSCNRWRKKLNKWPMVSQQTHSRMGNRIGLIGPGHRNMLLNTNEVSHSHQNEPTSTH